MRFIRPAPGVLVVNRQKPIPAEASQQRDSAASPATPLLNRQRRRSSPRP